MEIHFKSDLKDKNETSTNPTELAERKIRALKKYFKGTDETVQVYVEFGKATAAHQSGSIWRVQINLDADGRRYNATATSEQLPGAIDAAVKDLDVELRKAKQRARRMMRRGGSALKSFMRGFTG